MPAISLVVCVYNQRDLLRRLLSKTEDLFDDLVVVHDGYERNPADETVQDGCATTANNSPAIDYVSLPREGAMPAGYSVPPEPAMSDSIHAIVLRYGGKFFEGPRCFQQEPHWPFAWSRAKYDWILRLDADEFPSDELKEWLAAFKSNPEPPREISGYSCFWPCWNGRRAVTQKWPAGRVFLFHRRRVRFVGIPEQTLIPDTKFEALPFMLHHQPTRRSHGIRNVLLRKQAYTWRRLIARALLKRPVDLPRWRRSSENWPERWEEVQRHPLRTAVSRLIFDSLRTLRDQWKAEKRIHFGIGISGPIHHALFCIQFWRLRRTLFQRNKKNGS